MESATLKRYLTGITPLAVLSALLLAALLMMSAATQNSAVFGRMYSSLLLVNVLGIILLLALIALNLLHLIAQYRARILGSRLMLRLVIVSVVLVVLPVSVVFFFSLQTLNRGIDNWFDVKIEQAMDDALLLGRTALEATKQDLLKNTKDMAVELELSSNKTVLPLLNYLREEYAVTEITLFAQDGRIIASSSQEGLGAGTLVPDRPTEAILTQIRQRQTYANLDAVSDTGLRLRVVVPVYAREVGAPIRILQVLQTLPPRYAKLGESVQSAYAEYQKLLYLRGPLKFGFTLTLSLVALLATLIAVSAAIFFARRLVAPIRELAEGTRAVARGDYRKQIPVKTHDEIGVLVQSFNVMTRRIHRAQSQIKRSQREAEMQRTYLETVLTHLSSGVLSFDQQHVLRTHNAAADQILGADLEAGTGKPLSWMGKTHASLQPFVEAIDKAIASAHTEWQVEVTLTGQSGPRTLLVRGSLLPGPRGKHDGYVVVFDEMTALIQAQRAAAWGEVARRMAHEIKNPLTPIQLSAERIRHKYLHKLADNERQTLDRATRTIVEQVESLKSMVNAFSDYARSALMQAAPINLNDLIRDVVELYKSERHSPNIGADTKPADGGTVTLRRSNTKTGDIDMLPAPVSLKLDLDPDLPRITADPGRLRQVLHNLLLNARGALSGRTKPVISISTRGVRAGEQSYVELVVQDNGPGFPESLMERLFEPYVTDKEKGTGLGLAIVKRIIEEHAGFIQAENLKQGGAGITIRLPVNKAAAVPGDASNNHFNARERGNVPKGKSKRAAQFRWERNWTDEGRPKGGRQGRRASKASRSNPARAEKHT